MRGDPARARDLDEAVRVRAVRRADHEQEVDLGEHLLHRPLAVRGRVADVLAVRRAHVREAPPERRDDLRGLVDRERRLRDVGHVLSGREVERLRVLDRLDERDRLRRLAHRALDLLVAGMADEDDGAAVGGVAARLHVHLGDERAGRVDRVQPPLARTPVHGGRDSVGGEDERGPFGRVPLVGDEDGALGLEVADDVRVVDDLPAHVDRRPVEPKHPLDRLDGPLDPGAVPTGRGEEDALHHTGGHASHGAREGP